MSSEMVVFNELNDMAVAVAKSGMLGTKSVEDALTIMLVAQSEGKHPGSVIKDYHIINGKPTMKADAMLARFQQAGGKVEWVQLSNEIAEAKFYHEAGGTVTISWTIQDAERAGLTKNATWKKFPRGMLRSRVVSEGVRTVYPAVISGTYTPEEQSNIPQQVIPEPEQPRVTEAVIIDEVTAEDRKRVSDMVVATGWSAEKIQAELGISGTSELTMENKEEIFNKLNIIEEN